MIAGLLHPFKIIFVFIIVLCFHGNLRKKLRQNITLTPHERHYISKSPASRPFVHQLVQTNSIKHIRIIATLCKGINRWPVGLPQKGSPACPVITCYGLPCDMTICMLWSGCDVIMYVMTSSYVMTLFRKWSGSDETLRAWLPWSDREFWR